MKNGRSRMVATGALQARRQALLADLEVCAADIEAARRALDKAVGRRTTLVARGRKMGLGYTEMAKAARVRRETLYAKQKREVVK